MLPKSTQYRKQRNLAWLLYLLVTLLLFYLTGRAPEGSNLYILGTLPILALFPMIIYTCVLTHRARVEDHREFTEEMKRRNVTAESVSRFLTDKTIKGAKNAWAEDVLFWIFGVPAIGMGVFILFLMDDTSLATRTMGSIGYLAMAYVFIYLLLNSKKQRKLANLYALLFAASTQPEYTFPELASSASRQNAGPEVARLVDRNYMMNLEVEPREDRVRIVGFRRVPKNAYVCSNCGGASSIPVGAAKICYYCGRPLHN